MTMKQLSPSDRDKLNARLNEFRTEFACWREMFTNDWDLLEFVRYEGIVSTLADEVAPLVLGEKCVAIHGASWCIIQVDGNRHLAINHETLAQPVDLTKFNRKRVERTVSEAWQRRLDLKHPAR